MPRLHYNLYYSHVSDWASLVPYLSKTDFVFLYFFFLFIYSFSPGPYLFDISNSECRKSLGFEYYKYCLYFPKM